MAVIFMISAYTSVDTASSGNPPASGEADWRYVPRMYFVRDHFDSPGDGVPSLCATGTVLVAVDLPATNDAPIGNPDQIQVIDPSEAVAPPEKPEPEPAPEPAPGSD